MEWVVYLTTCQVSTQSYQRATFWGKTCQENGTLFHFTSNPGETWSHHARGDGSYTLCLRNTDALSSAHGVRTRRHGWAFLLPLAERREAPPCSPNHWLPWRKALRLFITPMLQPRENTETAWTQANSGARTHTTDSEIKENRFVWVEPDESNLTKVSKYYNTQCR